MHVGLQVAQLPGLWLRTTSVKVCHNLFISPLELSRRFICKMVEVSWNKIVQRSVAMVMGAQELQSQKVCHRACHRRGPFPVPEDGSTVVVSSPNSELSCTMVSHNHVVMCDGFHHEFKVTVGNHSLRVVKSN